MSYNVSIKTIPERYAATVRMVIPHYEDEGMVWQILCDETSRMNLLPAAKVTSCTVKGGYEQMPEVYGAVISWVKENGYALDGAMFNIYHVSPHETQNPDEFVTEICYPVK